MTLLKRDNIELSEIDDYHIYPIADNDTPLLSSDRLEYSLSNALFTYNLLEIADIKEIYNDIEIQANENTLYREIVIEDTGCGIATEDLSHIIRKRIPF